MAAAAFPNVIGRPGSDFTLAAYRVATENNVERARSKISGSTGSFACWGYRPARRLLAAVARGGA